MTLGAPCRRMKLLKMNEGMAFGVASLRGPVSTYRVVSSMATPIYCCCAVGRKIGSKMSMPSTSNECRGGLRGRKSPQEEGEGRLRR